MRKIIAYCVGILGIYEWTHLLGPVIRDFISGKRFHEVLFDLIDPSSGLNQDLFSGYIFILLSLVVIPLLVFIFRNVTAYWINAYVPISVLETHLTLEILDGHARLTREQWYHANRRGQTAYIARSTSNAPTGRIDRSSISFQSHVGGKKITDRIEIFGSEKSVEIIELFKHELPRNLLATVLPDNAVLYLHKSFGLMSNAIVHRKATIVSEHEYDGPEATLTLTALRYPVSNVRVTVKFPVNRAPADLQALLIRDNSGHTLDAEVSNDGDGHIYEVKVGSFIQCSLHVYWRNP